MKRKEETKLNIIFSVLLRFVSAIVGLVLPRMILVHYGSEANGMMQAINQILSYAVLFEFGIGGVILAAFYKPLAENDKEAISDIFNYTKSYFKKISILFLGLVVVLAFTAKFIISTGFDYMYVVSMVLILSLTTYFSYYFGIPHQLLMKSHQKIRIVNGIQIITILVNFAACVLLINAGCTIHMVKLVSAFVFLLNPIVYRIYVRKNFEISKNIYDPERKYPRKRDGVIHHFSYFIHENTDIVLLSIICGAATVSVYSVYNSVMIMTTGILTAVSSGISGAFGNMIALRENDKLKEQFDKYECANTAVGFSFFAVIMILILPFVRVYTNGIEDIEYVRPLFALLIGLGSLMYCIRIPYAIVVGAAGHYNETKSGALIEVIMNLVISIILIKPFGMVGVAAGTFFAMAYRTFYTVWYLSKNILKRPAKRFYARLCVNIMACIVVIFILREHISWMPENITEFIIEACKISLVVFPVYILLNFLILALGKRLCKE